VDAVTRRKFLLVSGIAGGGALAAGATGIGLAQLLATARHNADPTATKLVIVTLYGGNDGLNTVVPYADPRYRSARPELAYEPHEVLHLDGSLGLNPALRGLKRLWDAKRLAIVLGAGYPKPDLSHFRSMDIWQTASPGSPVGTGWVGRWLDATRAAPEAAVSFEPVLPPLLAGATRAGACVRPGGLRLPGGMTETMLAALGQSVPGEPALQARAAGALQDLLRVDRVVRAAGAGHGNARAAGATAQPGMAAGGALQPEMVAGDDQSLSDQLTLVAQCVEAGVPTRVYSASLGGFDSHAGERAMQERTLGLLDGALSAFVDRMAKTAAGRRVVVLVYSEFGRRVRANASQGTDHGTAGPVFVLGPGVAGGLLGEQPSLGDLDDGDLKVTSDFRDVYGTLLTSVLQAEPERYLEGYRPRLLPLLQAKA
jgi:uncharacterized protein (DUF1501 family)